MRPQGLKPELILWVYAALKRRSSTVLQAFVSLLATRKAAVNLVLELSGGA